MLGKIRDAVAGDRESDWQTKLDQRMKQPPLLIRPRLPEDLYTHFSTKLEQSSGSCERIDSYEQIADSVDAYLLTRELKPKIRVAPALTEIVWNKSLEVSYGNSRGNDPISVTPAFCAVAETGSVVLLSGEKTPTTLNFLPDVHIVILFEEQILPRIEDAWVKLRAAGTMPRTVNFITGPSKTADVEQTLQIGAHGPRDLRVILVGGKTQH